MISLYTTNKKKNKIKEEQLQRKDKENLKVSTTKNKKQCQ